MLLDSGTTCLEVARHLNHSRLTVVTHDLLVGIELSRKPQINVVFIGGELLPNSTSMWGPTSLQQLENMIKQRNLSVLLIRTAEHLAYTARTVQEALDQN